MFEIGIRMLTLNKIKNKNIFSVDLLRTVTNLDNRIMIEFYF